MTARTPIHAGQRLSDDRSQSPSEVNATIVASIQYWDRVARFGSSNTTSARSCAITRPATCPATRAPTWAYQMPFAETTV